MNPIVPDNNNHPGDHYNASGVVPGGVAAPIVPVPPALVLPAVGGGMTPSVACVVQAALVLPPVLPAAAGGIVEADPVFLAAPSCCWW